MAKSENFNKNLKFAIIFVIFIDAFGMFDLLIITCECGYCNTMNMNWWLVILAERLCEEKWWKFSKI